jgi:hypothetical protein
MIGGMVTIVLAESHCPPEAIISGMCTSEYMRYIEKVVFVLFPSIAAILVVLLPTLTAPSKKIAVAITFYVLGSSAAVYMGVSLKEWLVLACALTSGGLTLYSIYVYQTKRKNI